MATAATFPRIAPLRTRIPLLALAWVTMLAPALAPADSVQPRRAQVAPAVASSPVLASVSRAAAPEIETDAALPAIFEVAAPVVPPVQVAQQESVHVTPPDQAEPPHAASTPQTVISARERERQPQQFAVSASGPPVVVATAPQPAVAGSGAAPTAIATPAPAVAVASPPTGPPAFSGREQRLFEAINAQRASAGLPPLLANATLTQAARSRSQDMVTNNYFAHFGPRGQSWYTALAAVGWSMSGGGENLARVAGDERASVADALERLMASPTHRANIVSQSFRLVGVGAVVDAAGITIFTTIFTDR